MEPLAQTVAVLPQSLEAERSVLGCMLQDAKAVNEALEGLQKTDFYSPEHQEIFDAIASLNRQGLVIDLTTAVAELSKRGTLAGVGGEEYLITLATEVPSAFAAPSYIKLVSEKAALRNMIKAAGEISQKCYTQTEELESVLAFAEKQVFDISMRRSGDAQLHKIDEVLVDTYDQIDELARLKGAISGVPTGFATVDNLLTGLHGGELILVGARPSMGKTSFAINVAVNAARRGKKVAVFSLEMPKEQIAMRMICCDARVNMQHVRKGILNDAEWTAISRSIAPLSTTDIYIDDTSGLTPGQLRTRCRKLAIEKGLDLILVDYLQLMGWDGSAESRQVEVSKISGALKGIAKELKVPLVALAQLSRANEKRGTGGYRPMLSDLRDSGSIEQDADVVMFLHREAYYHRDDPQPDNTAEVIIAKQRNGPLGTAKLAWLGEFTLFDNLMGDN